MVCITFLEGRFTDPFVSFLFAPIVNANKKDTKESVKRPSRTLCKPQKIIQLN